MIILKIIVVEDGDGYRYHIEQDFNLNLWEVKDYCTFSRVYNFKYPLERNDKNIIQVFYNNYLW